MFGGISRDRSIDIAGADNPEVASAVEVANLLVNNGISAI